MYRFERKLSFIHPMDSFGTSIKIEDADLSRTGRLARDS